MRESKHCRALAIHEISGEKPMRQELWETKIMREAESQTVPCWAFGRAALQSFEEEQANHFTTAGQQTPPVEALTHTGMRV